MYDQPTRVAIHCPSHSSDQRSINVTEGWHVCCINSLGNGLNCYVCVNPISMVSKVYERQVQAGALQYLNFLSSGTITYIMYITSSLFSGKSCNIMHAFYL